MDSREKLGKESYPRLYSHSRLLTMRKNSQDDIKARICNLTSAKYAYAELKKAYEGKTATEFYALLDSLISVSFDDRKSSIEEHVTNYERTWNCFVGVVSRAVMTDLGKDSENLH
jgi:hypothetical protein